MEDALEADMNGYDRYLQENGSQKQLNGFRMLRTNVTNSVFDFTPSHRGVSASFLNWLPEANRQRRRRDEVECTRSEALQHYDTEVVREAPEEVSWDWERVVTHHWEENRRMMYGHQRGSYSQLIEGLRTARNTAREVVWASLAYGSNAVSDRTRLTTRLLRRLIAKEQRPTPQQWNTIHAALQNAESWLVRLEERAREERVNEMARVEIPRTPRPVDDDASTVSRSPPPTELVATRFSNPRA